MYFKALLVFLACVTAVCAQDRIRWAYGDPSNMSSEGPYVAHVQYTADGRRTIVATIMTRGGDRIATGRYSIARASEAYASVQVPFSRTLTVGATYTVEIRLESPGGRVYSRVRTPHRVVREDIEFDPEPALPAGTTYELGLRYTATERRYVVIAVKNPADTEYQGSARGYLEPGEDRHTTITVNFGGGGLSAGQLVIIRADIRPMDTTAAYRYDRTERRLRACEGPSTPPAAPPRTPPAAPPRPPPAAPPVERLRNTVAWDDHAPRSIGTCRPFVQRIRYTAPTGPVRLQLTIRTAEGRYLRGGWARRLPAGRGEARIVIRDLTALEVGTRYIVSADIRTEAEPMWFSKLAEIQTARRIRAMAC